MKKRKLIDLNIENNHLNQFKFNLNENTSDFVKSHLLNTISINEITLNTTSINDIGNLNEFQDIINDIQKMNSFFRNEKFEIINDLIKKHKNSKIQNNDLIIILEYYKTFYRLYIIIIVSKNGKIIIN